MMKVFPVNRRLSSSSTITSSTSGRHSCHGTKNNLNTKTLASKSMRRKSFLGLSTATFSTASSISDASSRSSLSESERPQRASLRGVRFNESVVVVHSPPLYDDECAQYFYQDHEIEEMQQERKITLTKYLQYKIMGKGKLKWDDDLQSVRGLEQYTKDETSKNRDFLARRHHIHTLMQEVKHQRQHGGVAVTVNQAEKLRAISLRVSKSMQTDAINQAKEDQRVVREPRRFLRRYTNV